MSVKINNKEYAFGDIQVFVLGAFILGLKEITYTPKKAKEHNHGAGREPRSIQHGKRTYEGTLGVTFSEMTALNLAARAKGYKDILDLDFDIVVSYAPEYSSVITVHKISAASITELPHGMKEGDLSSIHSMPYLALDVDLGVV